MENERIGYPTDRRCHVKRRYKVKNRCKVKTMKMIMIMINIILVSLSRSFKGLLHKRSTYTSFLLHVRIIKTNNKPNLSGVWESHGLDSETSGLLWYDAVSQDGWIPSRRFERTFTLSFKSQAVQEEQVYYSCLLGLLHLWRRRNYNLSKLRGHHADTYVSFTMMILKRFSLKIHNFGKK